ncbi:glycosyltransferase family 2 protein [Leifsonia sp. 2MCAF36]|uniref:glycosyltransferase family 2 protein n=1 Tax=Leifsonia sp. 2MCAF36 TaxID=3232988 RepID=UPI003F992422
MANRVSIVMRTRDRPTLLRRALASVASQTLREFELVVVNDGGDPATVDELLAATSGLGEPVVVHNTDSVGREEAVNVGVAASSAPLVAVLDDDDSWAPGYLEATVARLESGSDGAVAVRTEVVYERIEGDAAVEINREILRSDLRRVSLVETLYGNYVPPSSMVVRRTVFDEQGGWDGSLPVLADWEFTLKVLANSSIAFIDGEPLAFWHRREEETGPLGNSVHAHSAHHVEYTAVVRDGFLRSDSAKGGALGDALVIADSHNKLSRQIDLARQDLINHGAGNAFTLSQQIASLVDRLDGLSRQLDGLKDQLDLLNSRSFPNVLRRAASKTKSGVTGVLRQTHRDPATGPDSQAEKRE